MYRFDYEPVLAKFLRLRALHCAEVPIVLDNLSKGLFSYMLIGSSRKTARKLRDDMHTAWVSFAKTGNPNGNLELEWPRYDSEKRPTFIFNKESKLEMNPAEESYQVWKDIELYICSAPP